MGRENHTIGRVCVGIKRGVWGRGDIRGGGETIKEGVIRFGTYKISNDRNVSTKSVLHGMYQANTNPGVLQEP